VKLLLNRGAYPYLLALAAGVSIIAGCSSGRSLPSAGGAGLTPSSYVTATLTITGGDVMPDGCSNPAKLKICLKPGTHAVLGIKLTCHHSSASVPCGKVHWSTKMSNSLLAGVFKPNPGNPTKETITASKKIKLGHYHQDITARCTAFKPCVTHGKGAIWVI
jgi:hypothetical protein